jgi:hypothetical protein
MIFDYQLSPIHQHLGSYYEEVLTSPRDGLPLPHRDEVMSEALE